MTPAFSRTEEIAFSRGYRVTPTGSVFFRDHGERKMMVDEWGYLFFRIRVGAVRKRVAAHRLQAYQKFGERIYERGFVVRHHDGNPTNNAAHNILIGTPKQNAEDQRRHGRPVGPARKLNQQQVSEILTSPLKQVDLARKFGVSESTISVAKYRARAAGTSTPTLQAA